MLDPEMLRFELEDCEHSLREIASKYHITEQKVRRMAKKFNIRGRTKSEATEASIRKGTHPTFGKPRSEMDKNKISQSVKATLRRKCRGDSVG